jgi:hypothetical protein
MVVVEWLISAGDEEGNQRHFGARGHGAKGVEMVTQPRKWERGRSGEVLDAFYRQRIDRRGIGDAINGRRWSLISDSFGNETGRGVHEMLS